MFIKNIRISHFRSIESGELRNCGGLNVLIGKNNAGKSNLLACIELMMLHLRAGHLAGHWRLKRKGDFTDRDEKTPVRIGVEFELNSDLNEKLRQQLTQEAPHLERSIDLIKEQDLVSIILTGVSVADHDFLFVEQMVVGHLHSDGADLSAVGIKLLSVSKSVAHELYEMVLATQRLSKEVEALEGFAGQRSFPVEFLRRRLKERGAGVYREWEDLSRISRESTQLLLQQANSSISDDDFVKYIQELIGLVNDKIEKLEKQETSATISAFAGETRLRPAYAEWFMKQIGATPFLHIRESKRPIGRAEADTLLEFKVRRGGTSRLDAIQQTVRSLLGVSIDAFQAEGSEPKVAEMDVDDFLVEANGAGIREALRIILDIELRNPKLVLIEEPEVHLHPGLSRVIAAYLREKSRDIQMFLTTHSTEFVDSSFYKNIYIISRDKSGRTTSLPVEGENDALKIPSELGLRPSTVFMYDRLVFVEGPSDEAVLREIARKLDIDFSRANVGFVHMGGVRNFAHFAASSTLDLLSRRQIGLWFVADRDESDDKEVSGMMQRLGARANLTVLKKRELENYLLNETAIRAFIEEKARASRLSIEIPTVEAIREATRTQAASLKDEVMRLRMERRLLKPVFLNIRQVEGAIPERMDFAMTELKKRLESMEECKAQISANLDNDWGERCLTEAPGSLVLEKVAAHFGVSFNKERGDSEKLARLLPKQSVGYELADLLNLIVNAG
jgi:putative ATP-dependent endonuclease of OLD family